MTTTPFEPNKPGFLLNGEAGKEESRIPNRLPGFLLDGEADNEEASTPNSSDFLLDEESDREEVRGENNSGFLLDGESGDDEVSIPNNPAFLAAQEVDDGDEVGIPSNPAGFLLDKEIGEKEADIPNNSAGFLLDREIESGESNITSPPPEFLLDEETGGKEASISGNSAGFLLDEEMGEKENGIPSNPPGFLLDRELGSEDPDITSAPPGFLLDRELGSEDPDITSAPPEFLLDEEMGEKEGGIPSNPPGFLLDRELGSEGPDITSAPSEFLLDKEVGEKETEIPSNPPGFLLDKEIGEEEPDISDNSSGFILDKGVSGEEIEIPSHSAGSFLGRERDSEEPSIPTHSPGFLLNETAGNGENGGESLRNTADRNVDSSQNPGVFASHLIVPDKAEPIKPASLQASNPGFLRDQPSGSSDTNARDLSQANAIESSGLYLGEIGSVQTPNSTLVFDDERFPPDDFSAFLEDDEEVDKSRVPQKSGWAGDWSIRRKATALSLAIGVTPLAAVGGITYTIASRSISEQIVANQESRARATQRATAVVMNRFVEDTQAIARLPLIDGSKPPAFSQKPAASPPAPTQKPAQSADSALSNNLVALRNDPQLGGNVDGKNSFSEEVILLNDLITSSNGRYDQIAVFNLTGELLLQSDSSTPLDADDNYSNREHFRQAISTQSPMIGTRETVPSSNVSHLEVAAPIKNHETEQMMGVVVVRMSPDKARELFKYIQENALEYALADSDGLIFAATEDSSIGYSIESDLVGLPKSWPDTLAKAEDQVMTQVVTDRNDQEKVLASLTSISDIAGVSAPGWTLLITRAGPKAFEPLVRLRKILIIGTGSAAILAGAITAIMASRATLPLVAANHVVERLSKGDWDVRLEVQGTDELAVLCNTINGMAEQLEAFVGQRDLLQKRALELLLEVDPVQKGDLTVQARVTDDEVGTIADSYNAIIESLRRIVLQVKTATDQVEETTHKSEHLVHDLSEGASQQAERITMTTHQVRTMSDSIHAVAKDAGVAEAAVLEANQAVQAGNEMMDSTVDGIMAIRETVAETAKKVKRLGESSQKISTVVSLIKSFAEQTNVLALNASIEATRAGEAGRGFVGVVEEVQDLAQQSAKATNEIERLVESIQRATGEVVEAMEVGTEQVVSGTQLVRQTRVGLNQIVIANEQVNKVVEKISKTAVEQAEVSDVVTRTMAEVGTITANSVVSTADVASSFKELLIVADTLQDIVSQFKVS